MKKAKSTKKKHPQLATLPNQGFLVKKVRLVEFLYAGHARSRPRRFPSSNVKQNDELNNNRLLKLFCSILRISLCVLCVCICVSSSSFVRVSHFSVLAFPIYIYCKNRLHLPRSLSSVSNLFFIK